MICVLAWKRSGRSEWLAATLLASALIPGAWWLDLSVETDREQVERILGEFIVHYREGRLADVQAAISREAPLLSLAAAGLIERYNFEDERVTDISVAPDGDNYEIHFRLNADFIADKYGSVGRRPTRWLTTWVDEDDQWKLRDAKRLDPMNGKEVTGWRSLTR